jgi:tubby-related protein 1
MSFRSFLQDVRDGIGSISRRSFDVKFSYSLRSRSHSAVHDSHYRNEVLMPQSCWANMPPELLRDVISRIEASEGAWPARKHVVACSGVCRSWRAITKEIVKTPQLSGKLTFPISLRQVKFRHIKFNFKKFGVLDLFFLHGNHLKLKPPQGK